MNYIFNKPATYFLTQLSLYPLNKYFINYFYNIYISYRNKFLNIEKYTSI